MDYKENATVILPGKPISDGTGGFITQEKERKDIKCKVAPFTITDKDSVGRPVSYSRNKLFTKESIVNDLDDDFKILYNSKLYSKVSIADYGKCYMIVMERDS